MEHCYNAFAKAMLWWCPREKVHKMWSYFLTVCEEDLSFQCAEWVFFFQTKLFSYGIKLLSLCG